MFVLKLSMCADFQLLKRNVSGLFEPLPHEKIENISIGGYSFFVEGKVLPFDWDVFTGYKSEDAGRFQFETGFGWINDFELSQNCWEEEYAKLGIKREDISAQLLSSAAGIEEFYVYFNDIDVSTEVELCVGAVQENDNPKANYRVQLFKVLLTDMETEKQYSVKQEVLEAFNKGRRAYLLNAEEKNASAPSFDSALLNAVKRSEATISGKGRVEAEKGL